jgi:hypothetical protein
MYRLVSCLDRLPEIWQTYFILADGRKDIVTIPWMQKHRIRYPDHEFFWLEEVSLNEKKPLPKKKAVVINSVVAIKFQTSKPWLKE